MCIFVPMKTEKEIFKLVFHLFCKYGIKSLTMDDIASYLGISKKTLYKYVSDKTDLIEKVFSSIEKPHKIDMLLSGNLNAIEEFYEVYKTITDIISNYNPHLIFDLNKYYPGVYEKLRERRKKSIIKHVSENIIKGQKEGVYRKDINPYIIAELHYLKVESLIQNNFLNTKEFTVKQILEEMFKYHIYALANDKGRKIIEDFKIFDNDEK